MDHEFFLSIYPSFEFHSILNFSYQIVDKPGYYPKELELLVAKIKDSISIIERADAIQKFYEFVDYRKDDLIRLKKQVESHEKVNIRQIFILYNETYGPLKIEDGTDYVYLGGPLSGGHLILDYNLDQVKPLKHHTLITFDSKNVGIETNSIRIERKYLKPEITQANLDQIPIDINGIKFNLLRANVYFDSEYDKILAVNDFSPIIDSAVSASLLSIEMTMIYFQKFPQGIYNKLTNYADVSKLDIDLLCIRNTLNLLDGKVKIEGFSFYEKNRKFAFSADILIENLKYLLVSESDLNINLSYIDTLRDDEFLDQITYFSNLDYKSIAPLRGEILEEMGYKIGFDALQEAFDVESPVQIFPIAFFEFTLSRQGQIIFCSTFNEKELPKEFITVLQSFVEPLFVIKTGPIESFQYNPDIVEIHLKIGSETKNFSLVLSVKFLDDIPQTYMGVLSLKSDKSIDEELSEFYDMRNCDLPSWYYDSPEIKNLDAKLFFEMLPNILEHQNSINLSDPDMRMIFQRRSPIVSFIENRYSDNLEDNILQEILLEAENFELLGNMSADMFSLDGMDEAPVDDKYNEIMRKRAYKNKEERERIQLELLEREINMYNPEFFEFLLTNMNWEYDEFNLASTTSMRLRNIFDDIRIALIDFGLTPLQWVYADNIQLWSSFQSQLLWLRHSFTIKIRILIPNYDGEDLNKLCSYKNAKNIYYSIFTGKINGAEYTALKKAYMYFAPKIDKYQNEITICRSIDELIECIETEEQKSKLSIKSKLPAIPIDLN